MSALLGIAEPSLAPLHVLRAVAVEALEGLGLPMLAAAFGQAGVADASEWRSVRTAAGIAVMVLEPVHKQRFELADALFRVCDVALERIGDSP